MKQIVIIACYIFLALGSIIFGIFQQHTGKEVTEVFAEDAYVEIQTFYQVHLFAQEPGKPKIYFSADQFKSFNMTSSIFENPKGEIFTDDLGVTQYVADLGRYDGTDEILTLEGNVQFNNADFSFKSLKGSFDSNKSFFTGTGKVDSYAIDQNTKDKIFVKSELVEGYMKKKFAKYSKGVDGFIERAKKYQENTKFSSNTMDLDMEKKQIDLFENVKVKNQNFDISARKSEIYLDNVNKKLKYYVFYDDIEVEQKYQEKDGKWATRKAYSEKLEGYAADKKMILSGAPKVVQGKDVIRGNLITLRQNLGLVEVEDSSANLIYQGK